MNQFTAINAAADAIERDPASYEFSNSVYSPALSKMPICMLGHIMRAAGERLPQFVEPYAARGLGCANAAEFYQRVVALAPNPEMGDRALFSPSQVVPAMRKYASKYHGLPESVEKIFQQEFAEFGA